MAGNDNQRKQKQLKKRRRANQLKKERNIRGNLSERDILCEAKVAPWHGCWVLKDDSISMVYAVRNNRSRFVASIFLVDMACLGVKDAFVIRDFNIDALNERKNELRQSKPSYALKLINDSIEYARGIGFEPRPKALACLEIFGNTDTAECTDEFTFGFNGKPTYFSGPNDSPEFQFSILQTLKKLGEGNYGIVKSQEGVAAMDPYDDDDLYTEQDEDLSEILESDENVGEEKSIFSGERRDPGVIDGESRPHLLEWSPDMVETMPVLDQSSKDNL